MEASKFKQRPFTKIYKKFRDCVIKFLVFISSEFEYRRMLHFSVEEKDAALLEYMLTRGIDVNLRDEVFDWTPLHGACRCNVNDSHYEVTSVLLKHGASLNLRDQYGRTPLHYLVDGQNYSTVQLLLDYEVDLNVEDFRGEKPLHCAIKSGSTVSAQLMINHGAELENTILHKAIRRDDHLGILEVLLTSGAKINARDKYGNGPLYYAVKKPSNLDTVRLLLSHGADVHLKNHKGEAPLFQAVKYGTTEIVRLLIENGSDVDDSDRNGTTCLQIASWESRNDSHRTVIEALLSKGADPDVQSAECDTPLHWLVCRNSPGSIELLLDHGANVNAKGSHQEIALFNAIRLANLEIVKLLVDRGSDVNSPNSSELTPLHKAVMMGPEHQLWLAEILLKKGAKVDAQDCRGKTALHILAKTPRSLRVVELLLSFGARVDLKDKKGKVPLMNAVKSGNFKVAQLLLDSGSDPNGSSDQAGLTALHLAALNSDRRTLKLLLEMGADVHAVDSKGRTALLRLPKGAPELEMMLECSDPNVLDNDGKCIMDIQGDDPSGVKTALQHFAKLKVMGLFVNPKILREKILGFRYGDYFARCVEELKLAKSTKLQNSWVSFFNLLVDGDRKLKNYAGNEDLMADFNSKGYNYKFPIYWTSMTKNVEKGMKRRKLFDECALKLSECLWIFGPTHLIVTDTLDCVETKDLVKFCGKTL